VRAIPFSGMPRRGEHPRAAGTGAAAAAEADASAEAALVARLATGDVDEPVARLYDRYGRQVYRLGLRLLGERGRAEDLVQDTFVRLWQAAPRFDPAQGTVRTFLFVLARRAAVDHQRRAAARPPGPPRDPRAAHEPVAAAGEDALAGLEVREALESLPPKHRQVLELGYDHDLSQSQIAQHLDVPLGTVKTRTYHALRALGDELRERGIHG
jgi:RNA polymerase sigma-70 factor, ECF subfamily